LNEEESPNVGIEVSLAGGEVLLDVVACVIGFIDVSLAGGRATSGFTDVTLAGEGPINGIIDVSLAGDVLDVVGRTGPPKSCDEESRSESYDAVALSIPKAAYKAPLS
jgi:hypothetical protein